MQIGRSRPQCRLRRFLWFAGRIAIFTTGRRMRRSTQHLVYRASARRRAVALGVGGAMALAGLTGLAYWATGNDLPDASAIAVMVIITTAITALGLATAAHSMRHRVTLSADAIEQRGIFITRRLSVADIEGYRIWHDHRGRQLLFAAKPGVARGLDVTLSFPLDDAFRQWIGPLADLSQRDAEEKRQRVRQEIALGNSAEVRERRVATAHRAATWLNWAAIAATLWATINPMPYWLAVGALALIPWIALLMRWRDPAAYSIADDELKSIRANLYSPVMICGLVLLLRACLDIDLVDWTKIIVPTLVGGALLALAAGAARCKPFDAVLAFVMMAPYPAGLIPLINLYFDHASPRAVSAQVYAMSVTTGKHTAYRVWLSPQIDAWSDAVAIDKELFQGLSRLDRVCVLVHPGALGIEWFQVERAERCTKRSSR